MKCGIRRPRLKLYAFTRNRDGDISRRNRMRISTVCRGNPQNSFAIFLSFSPLLSTSYMHVIKFLRYRSSPVCYRMNLPLRADFRSNVFCDPRRRKKLSGNPARGIKFSLSAVLIILIRLTCARNVGGISARER